MESSVRHAIIAIGALSKQKESQLQPESKYTTSDYEYALKQYSKALRGMKDAIASGQHDLRKALVACLLVFCFEGLLGNQVSAAAHAESGLNLLYCWTNSNNPPKQTKKPLGDRVLENNVIEAFTALDL
jgi:hypothetical protein